MYTLEFLPTDSHFHHQYEIRCYRDERPLLTSIQRYGILSPLRVMRSGQTVQVIDGWARLDVARKLNLPAVPCLVESELPALDAFMLAMELNANTRQFNIVEQAHCLKIILDLQGGQKVPKLFYQVSGIRENVRAIHQYRELLRLPHLVLKYAATNHIPLPVILGFSRFPPTDVDKVANMLFVMPLNQNKLAEILGLLIDLSKRERVFPSVLLERALMHVESGLSATQREQRLRQMLHTMRNPHYEARLESFNDKLKKLPADPFIKVQPAPFFEDDYVEVTLRLTETADLARMSEFFLHDSWPAVLDQVITPPPSED